MERIRESIANAVEGAEDRLVAARIILLGTTPLHGLLHWEAHRIRAEVLALSQDFGEEAVWIEQVEVRTTPVYDLEKLKERDLLTKTVLETLEAQGDELTALPPEVTDMLGVLPVEIRNEVEREWKEARSETLDDVRAIVLEALQTKGGEES